MANEVQKIDPSANLPAYLQDTEVTDVSAKEMAHVIRPPYLKLVQSNTAAELREACGVGSTILMPNQEFVAKHRTPFTFTPLYFFREWWARTPYQMRNEVPSIIDRTRDPKSATAQFAMNPGTRRMTKQVTRLDGGTTTCEVQYMEVLNWLVWLWGLEGAEPAILSLSVGKYRDGQILADLIKKRGRNQFACVFQATVADVRKNTKGTESYGWDFSNPVEGPAWVEDPERYALFAALNKRAAESQIEFDLDDTDEVEGSSALDASMSDLDSDDV